MQDKISFVIVTKNETPIKNIINMIKYDPDNLSLQPKVFLQDFDKSYLAKLNNFAS